jgi:hypothetical protein
MALFLLQVAALGMVEELARFDELEVLVHISDANTVFAVPSAQASSYLPTRLPSHSARSAHYWI